MIGPALARGYHRENFYKLINQCSPALCLRYEIPVNFNGQCVAQPSPINEFGYRAAASRQQQPHGKADHLG